LLKNNGKELFPFLELAYICWNFSRKEYDRRFIYLLNQYGRKLSWSLYDVSYIRHVLFFA